jgi:hypothetical protein
MRELSLLLCGGLLLSTTLLIAVSNNAYTDFVFQSVSGLTITPTRPTIAELTSILNNRSVGPVHTT